MAEGIKKISENVIIDKRALIVTDPLVADNTAISIGAIWSDPTNKSIKLKVGANSFSLLDASKTFISGSVTSSLLADKCITTLKIADKAITEPKLADTAVSNRTIVNGAVTESKIGTSAVTSSKIKDSNILNKHYADLSITNNKIAEKTIEGSKIADKTIGSNQINDNAIIERAIANKAIKERHYGDKSIPSTAFQIGSVYGNIIKTNGITSTHLADNSVVTRTIANGAVDKTKIADKSIYNIHLSDSCVGSTNIEVNAILTKHINDSALTTSKYAKKSITKDKLADDVINLIGDPVVYDENNNVTLRNNLNVNGSVKVIGTLTAEKVYNSVFMDLAEAYDPNPEEVFNPGDIVQVNEDGKLTRAVSSSHFPIVGIVSDEYAACYGATEEELEEGAKIPVGLIGKIHVNVVGAVKLGDKIALIKDGVGASCSTNNLLEDNIIGKALESNNEIGLKKVLCLVYPR